MTASLAHSSLHGHLQVGRRNAARLRLCVPAKLESVFGVRRCVLIDLSRTGAQIALDTPLDTGEAGFLRFLGFDLFAEIVRKDRGGNGLEFEVALTDEQVLKVRELSENLDTLERRTLLHDVREWVTGER